MITVADVLALPVLAGASLVAGRQGVGTAVRWTHVSEVLDIARLLEGGELLLTTGIALDVPPGRQRTYLLELKERKVAGVMLELGRRFDQVPHALVEAADEVGLPLIALPYDTRFVKVTEAIHRELLVHHQTDEARTLMDDLLNARIGHWEALLPRLTSAGVHVTERTWFCGVVQSGTLALPLPVRSGCIRGVLAARSDSENILLVFGTEPVGLSQAMAVWARSTGAPAVGVGRCYREVGSVGFTIEEARQAAFIRRRRPQLDPRLDRMGVYALLADLDPAAVEKYVRLWLGPLLEYEANHSSHLLETLRVLLDKEPVAEAARRLYISRQGLYNRRDRLAAVLGTDLDDEEVCLALAVALRLHEGMSGGLRVEAEPAGAQRVFGRAVRARG